MDFRQRLFEYRSYTPIPFLLVMLLFAHPTLSSLLLGFMTIAMGEFIRLWGVAIAGSETRTTGPVGGTYLITRGPFSYVRNPLYLGNMLIYFGVGVMSNALFPWLSLIALLYFLWQYSLIVNLEEEHLRSKFGEEFRRYCQEVPRFFPSYRQFRSGNNPQPELNWLRGMVSEKRTLQAITFLTIVLVVFFLFRG